jgi:hypothetical protein
MAEGSASVRFSRGLRCLSGENTTQKKRARQGALHCRNRIGHQGSVPDIPPPPPFPEPLQPQPQVAPVPQPQPEQPQLAPPEQAPPLPPPQPQSAFSMAAMASVIRPINACTASCSTRIETRLKAIVIVMSPVVVWQREKHVQIG